MEVSIGNPLAYGVPIFAVFILFELVICVRHDLEDYDYKDMLTSVGTGVGASILALFTKAASLAMFFFLFEVSKEARVEHLGYASLGWGWHVWLVAIVADDFNFYWFHRWSHEIRFFWAAHCTHHSSRKFNLGSAVRNSWFTIFYKPFLWIWMPIVGFEPMMVAFALAVNAIYQFFLHTKFIGRLGLLEYVFNTPWHHRVHHSINAPYLDKNHGGMFVWWDKIFGTFRPIQPDDEEPKYGVLKEPEHYYNPLDVATFEYRRIFQDIRNSKSLYEAWMYTFGPPGWSPDGSRQTAKQLAAEYEAKRREERLKKRFGETYELQPEPAVAKRA